MSLQWRSALGFVLSVLLLVWTLHDVEWSSVVAHIRAADVGILAASVIAATMIFPLRARRWRTILSPIEADLPFGPLWRSTAIGMMINNVVPARAGEVARAYALSRELPRIPFSTAFASLAVDRVFDAFTILLLTLAAMFDPVFPKNVTVVGQPVANWLVAAAAVAGAAVVLLYAIVFFPAPLVRVYEGFARRVAPRFEARGRDALLAFAAGLGVLRSPTRFAAVMGWTLAHWLLNAFAFWLGFKAFGIHVSFGAAVMLQGLIAIGVSVPSAPGFFGIFEAMSKAGLAIYGIPAALAVSWAIGFHLLTFIPITVIGIYYFATLGLHMREIKTAPQTGVAGESAG
ncbi:MAG: lysylphosphatidylglycerol synthase transmembrane domain-containing protein [Gemmatimonadaceae bacterium]